MEFIFEIAYVICFRTESVVYIQEKVKNNTNLNLDKSRRTKRKVAYKNDIFKEKKGKFEKGLL